MKDFIERSEWDEACLRCIVNVTPIALLVIDDHHVISLVNDEAESLFGYSRKELIGKSVRMLVPPSLSEKLIENYLNLFFPTMTPQEHATGAFLALTKSATEIPVELKARRFDHEGRNFLLFAFVDTTLCKTLQTEIDDCRSELARANMELAEFTYAVSHDLQEPLRKIVSSCQAFVEDHGAQVNTLARRWIDYIVDGAQRMQQMVNDLLALSRIATSGIPLSPVDAMGVARLALANLEASIKESSTNVVLQPLPAILADEHQLIQLFENLIDNAIKYRGPETPRIEIGTDSTRPCEPSQQVFYVRDNGQGIAPEHVERIFVVFQRLHRRGEYSGAGIGLALSKKIVQRHGGKIWVESTQNKGSTFFFALTKPLILMK